MLEVQKVDRRMDGNLYFKYRVKFSSWNFRQTSDDFQGSFNRCALALLNCCEYMTKKYGYGPELSLVRHMSEPPIWAIRSSQSGLNTHKPTAIYLRDDDALEKFNAVLSFYHLQKK